jgi:hypothetical protein
VHDCAVPLLEPSPQKKFVGQRLLVPMLVPAEQKKPYGHAVIDVGVEPLLHTKPGRHGWHAVDPPTPYWPAAHSEPADDTAPLPQPKPAAALQLVQLVAPPDEKRPGTHRPLHVDDVIPAAAPNDPASHCLHAASPARLYVPTPHALPAGAAVVEPDGHT